MRLGVEQLGHLRVVLEVGARRVAPRVAAAAVLLAEQARRASGRPRRRSPTPRGCGGARARRAPRPSRRRGRAAAGSPGTGSRRTARRSRSRHRRAHRDDVEGGVVDLARRRPAGRSRRCRGTAPCAGAGSRSAVTRPSACSSFQTTRSLPSPFAGEVAVHDLGHEQAVGLAPRASCVAQHRPDAGLELLVGLAAALLGPELPLVAEQRGLVDVGRDVVERDALDDRRAEERRHEHRVVGRRPRATAPGASTAASSFARAARSRQHRDPPAPRPKSGSSSPRALAAPSGGPSCGGPRTRPCRRTAGRRRPRGGRARRRCG